MSEQTEQIQFKAQSLLLSLGSASASLACPYCGNPAGSILNAGMREAFTDEGYGPVYVLRFECESDFHIADLCFSYHKGHTYVYWSFNKGGLGQVAQL